MKCLLHTLNTRLGATALMKKVGCEPIGRLSIEYQWQKDVSQPSYPMGEPQVC